MEINYCAKNGFSLSSILIIALLIISIFLCLIYLLFSENILVLNQRKNNSLQLNTLNAINENYFSSQGSSLLVGENDDSSFKKLANVANSLYLGIKVEKKINDSLIVFISHGTKPDQLLGNAIILTRPELTPTVAGKTNITGDLLTAKRKINQGRLFGVPPLNPKYLNGEIIVNEEINSRLFNDSLIKNIFNFTTYNESNEELNEPIEIMNDLTINKIKKRVLQIPTDISIEGFLEKGNGLETLELYVSGLTHFTNETKSTYNLQIYSDSTISIGDNVNIENSVLVSQTSIDVGSNCSFKNVQLFAKDSITISDSEFLFPSVIGLYVETDSKNKYDNKIDISSSVINGTVMLVSSTVGLDENKSKIKIDEESVVHGLVYSENNLELYGEVKGCVYTYNFLYMDGKKEYLNWLVNVKVNRHELDDQFLLPMGFVENPEYSLIKEEWYHKQKFYE
ncbi:MAG: hypothetical protein HND52_05020 [Ignavibacteriae bacterium]|nr:hypothetical protein [Ignavibacteriota bacterium]NOG97317.1 hypothetical protein [Ignavibacteriota bacterium]